ncbi:MAG: Ig-like domain-containing protein [Flavobacteriales bacterium]|nr:Ig-like domain-containing protein [Flavobacteriales bacterium]
MTRSTLLLGFISLVCSCAQVKPITGGEKDNAPPVLVKALPANGSVDFRAEAIYLEFDERIQLDRVRERLLVSPPLDEAPTVRVLGSRSVDIRLNAPLKANTTYTFNLGECVKDLTESNPAAGLNYVFSTGSTLDSLQVTGAVVNAFTGASEKDMFVMLYNTVDTGTFRTSRPAYVTKSDELGVFRIDHLPAGSYSVYALRDKNSNYRYDLPNEEIAFLDTSCVLAATDTIAPVVLLRSFLPASAEQQVRSYKVIPDGALQLVLARAADTLTVRDIARTGGSLQWKQRWNITRDTVTLWPSDTTLLGSGFYEIGDARGALDTLRYKPVQRMPFHTGLSASLVEDPAGAWVRIRTTRPITYVDTSRFVLMRDSMLLPFRVEATGDEQVIAIYAEMPPATSTGLVVGPKAVRDIYGGMNDTLRISFGRAADQGTGTLRVELKHLPEGPAYLLQLLDAQQRIGQESSIVGPAASVKWERLSPGIRTIRLVADTNGNGTWDTGEWATLRQPERTWYHPEPVNVRAAWDVVVDWVLD